MLVVATEKVMVVVVKVKSGRFSKCIGQGVKLYALLFLLGKMQLSDIET